MLGSPFDLKREIARIAAERTADAAAQEKRAYPEFDDKLKEFIRALSDDDWSDEPTRTPRQTSGETHKQI